MAIWNWIWGSWYDQSETHWSQHIRRITLVGPASNSKISLQVVKVMGTTCIGMDRQCNRKGQFEDWIWGIRYYHPESPFKSIYWLALLQIPLQGFRELSKKLLTLNLKTWMTNQDGVFWCNMFFLKLIWVTPGGWDQLVSFETVWSPGILVAQINCNKFARILTCSFSSDHGVTNFRPRDQLGSIEIVCSKPFWEGFEKTIWSTPLQNLMPGSAESLKSLKKRIKISWFHVTSSPIHWRNISWRRLAECPSPSRSFWILSPKYMEVWIFWHV